MDSSNTSNDKRKQAGAAFLIIAASFVIGSIIATQFTAAACDYNPLLGFNIAHIYPPYGYYFWRSSAINEAIPYVLQANEKYIVISIIAGILGSYAAVKSMQKTISHGSAEWARAEDIIKSGLGEKEGKRKIKNSGVVVGINPYTDKLMLHNGPEHVLLMAPTRSGKGVNTIIPTGLVWQDSIFFLDVKGELWQATSGYRKEVLKQKVMKFQPLCKDGSAARWNPLAEIDFMTSAEVEDTNNMVAMMVKSDGDKQSGSDPFWDNSAAALLKGIILHLLYKHYREGRELPNLGDVMSFLSSPDVDTEKLFLDMKFYPAISVEEFLEINGKKNILKEIYHEYIKNFKPYNERLGCNVHSLDELRDVIRERADEILWDMPEDEDDEEHMIFSLLLAHPRVAECASNMLNGAEQTRASIMQTAQTAMALYQDPIIQRNTAKSDFCIRDLLNPNMTLSVYLVIEFKDMETLKPLCRLFVNKLLTSLIQEMKFESGQNSSKKQRLLLMLDEYPQLGQLSSMERALAVSAGYGIKICIVAQDVNQLNKAYTKDNSIASNCHVHIYFTPNLDTDSGTTAKNISAMLGKKTIQTSSHSDGGGLFKGSNSTSFTSRELMTPDEVSHMSSEREIVFVAGHKPILGKKLRYYNVKWFNDKVKAYPEPLYSDTATRIYSFGDLLKIHSIERRELEERVTRIAAAKETAAKKMKEGANNETEKIQEYAQKEAAKENDEGTLSKEAGDDERKAFNETRAEDTGKINEPEDAAVAIEKEQLEEIKNSLEQKDEQ
jgi:type IV secretory pathway TraG/TraD family ATPase VirD4